MKLSKSDKRFSDGIEIASEYIKNGDVVAFPTETVYGLGGSVFIKSAVEKIFEVKHRPEEKPLSVLISKPEDMKAIAIDIPKSAHVLAENFWPGPLTMILKKNKDVPNTTSACKDTIGLRIPDHPIPLKIIEKTGPLACPSANISGNPAPVTCFDVAENLAGYIPLILNGGKTEIGTASTIIDMTKPIPKILRKGTIDISDIEKIITVKK